MDTKNYLPEKTASHRRPLIVKVIIGLLLLGAIAYGTYSYLNKPGELSPETSYQTTAVTEEQREFLKNSDISGYIQLTRVDTMGSTTDIEIVNYHPADDTFSIGANDGSHLNFYPTSSSTGAVLKLDDETGQLFATSFDFEKDFYEILPLETGQTTYSVYTKPDNTWYAMDTFPVNILNTEEVTNLSNWKIHLYDSTNDLSLRFLESASPQWLNNGQDLLFLKSNGIFQYNLEPGTETGNANRIFDLYSNISGRARLSASDRSDYMVLTLPTANTISVLHFDNKENSTVREVRRITSNDTWYRSPVMSPEGTQFAVIAVSYSEEENVSKNTLEIYSVLDNEPIYKKDLSDMLPGKILLSSWQLYEVTAPFRTE